MDAMGGANTIQAKDDCFWYMGYNPDTSCFQVNEQIIVQVEKWHVIFHFSKRLKKTQFLLLSE